MFKSIDGKFAIGILGSLACAEIAFTGKIEKAKARVCGAVRWD